MRKRLLIGSLALLLGWCDVALAQRSGGVLRIFHRDNPTSASILEETNASTVVAFMPVFNNLVMFDPAVAKNADDTIVPDLAESWTWNDDRTELSFKLRRGAKWHDGMPFTSSDVECTFNLLTNRARNRLRTNPRGSWFGNVNFVRAPTDFDVTIHLNRPQPSLLAMLASGFVPIYPCHVPLAQMRVKPVGTGPFKLESFNQFDRIRLVRNPDYWKAGRPYLDGIEFSVVASRSTALLSFVAGRYDMTFPSDVSMSQLRDVRRPVSARDVRGDGDEQQHEPDAESRGAAVRQPGCPPGPDAHPGPTGLHGLPLGRQRRHRRASAARPGRPLGSAGGDVGQAAGLRRRPGEEPDRGPRADAQGGVRAGQASAAEDLHARGLALSQPAAVLATQLQEIYFEPTLDVVETVHWFTRLQRRDFALAIETTGNAIDDPDQVFYETFACRSERNYNRYCNPEIERLFEAQSSELDVEKRRQLVWDLEARLLADSARPPLMWNRAATCWQPYVQGFVPQTNSSYNGFRFEDVWIDRR